MFRDPVCSTFRKVFVTLILGVGVFLIPNGVQSAISNTATIQWAFNTEPDLAGYRIYHGTTSGVYSSSKNVGRATSYQFTNLAIGKTHYFAVAAYDLKGNESPPSPEVFKTILSLPSPPQNPTPNPSPNPDVNPNPNPAPNPVFPILVNFQPTTSDLPLNFIKDDGSVFTDSRGYGWDILVNGEERNARVNQTLDTFVQVSNKTPVMWNYALPNGTYYLSMVVGDPKKNKGRHTLNVEGMELATQIKTKKGQYLTVVEYPVDVRDNTLSITLGGGGRGKSLLNFLMINSAPDLSQTVQTLAQSFGTNLLIANINNSGAIAKINPQKWIKQEKKYQKALAKVKRKLGKIAQKIASLDTKIVTNVDKPKKVAKYQKKKGKLTAIQGKILAKMGQIAEKYDIN